MRFLWKCCNCNRESYDYATTTSIRIHVQFTILQITRNISKRNGNIRLDWIYDSGQKLFLGVKDLHKSLQRSGTILVRAANDNTLINAHLCFYGHDSDYDILSNVYVLVVPWSSLRVHNYDQDYVLARCLNISNKIIKTNEKRVRVRKGLPNPQEFNVSKTDMAGLKRHSYNQPKQNHNQYKTNHNHKQD